MFNFPFLPTYFNSPYYRNYYYKNKSTTSNTSSTNNYIEKNSEPCGNQNTKNSQKHSTEGQQAVFSIFGIDLYNDDIIILCLLFFLYNEGIKDEMLFLCLILLLIS